MSLPPAGAGATGPHNAVVKGGAQGVVNSLVNGVVNVVKVLLVAHSHPGHPVYGEKQAKMNYKFRPQHKCYFEVNA